MDDVAILVERLVAVLAFGWLLAQTLGAFGGEASPEVRRSRIAIGLVWAAMTFVSVYASLLYLGVPVNRDVGDVAVGALSVATLNLLAALACLWAYQPWRK